MFFDCRAIMISKCKTLFLTSSIIRYNNNGDLPSVFPSNSKFLLNILISDSFVVVVNSNISYKSNALAFFTVIVTLKSSSYLILYSRYYSTFFS